MNKWQKYLAAVAMLPAIIEKVQHVLDLSGEPREDAIVDVVDSLLGLIESLVGKDIANNVKVRDALSAALDVRPASGGADGL